VGKNLFTTSRSAPKAERRHSNKNQAPKREKGDVGERGKGYKENPSRKRTKGAGLTGKGRWSGEERVVSNGPILPEVLRKGDDLGGEKRSVSLGGGGKRNTGGKQKGNHSYLPREKKTLQRSHGREEEAHRRSFKENGISFWAVDMLATAENRKREGNPKLFGGGSGTGRSLVPGDHGRGESGRARDVPRAQMNPLQNVFHQVPEKKLQRNKGGGGPGQLSKTSARRKTDDQHLLARLGEREGSVKPIVITPPARRRVGVKGKRAKRKRREQGV